MYGSYLLQAGSTAKLAKLHDKYKLLDTYAVLLAVNDDGRRLQRARKALGSTSRSQYIVEDGYLEGIAHSPARSDVAQTVV